MLNFLISIILGLIPEVLYFTLFIIYAKGIKTKRLKLFALLSLGYILLIMLCRFQFLFYLAYIVYSYLILKLLYRSQIIDLFICSFSLMYMTIVSFLGYKIFGFNYVIYYIFARIILYLILIFKSKIRKIYINYYKLWNICENPKIKSLTIRNTSLIILNIFIILINTFILMIIS